MSQGLYSHQSSHQKVENLPITDFKTHNKYYFSSPQRESIEVNSINRSNLFSTYKFRSPLQEQETDEYNRVKSQLKRGIASLTKENSSRLNNYQSENQQNRANYVQIQQLIILEQEHKYQVQRLLYQIQKLHQSVFQVETHKRLQIQKLKQQNQKQTYISLANAKQTHSIQVDLLQNQLRKTKQLLNQKTSQYQIVSKRYERDTKHLTNENNRLNQQIRQIIQKKNDQIQRIHKSTQDQVQKVITQSNTQQQSNRRQFQIQINRIQSQLQQKSLKLQSLVGLINSYQNSQLKLESQLERARQQSAHISNEIQNQSREKYISLKERLDKDYQSSYNALQNNYQLNQQLLKDQIKTLRKFVAIKNQDRDQLIKLHDERVNFFYELKNQADKQNEVLKAKLKESQQQSMQQTQILKVKMALLHQNTLGEVVKTYESKIDSLLTQINLKQSQCQNLRNNLYTQTGLRHECRKKFNIELSKLSAKLIKLRSGISTMQVDFKQKIQNQRSMMLLTSRSIIKDVQTKTQQMKFHQEELRKLRQLFDLQQKQVQQGSKQVQQKIQMAQAQLTRLSRKIVQEKKNHQQTQQRYQSIFKYKDNEIQQLRTQLENTKFNQFDNSQQLKLIQQLKGQIREKNSQISKLKGQIDLLQKKLSIFKAQLDQYQLEQQITQQQAKQQFQQISKANMQQFRKFYENRITQLQKDKIDLNQVLSLKEENITSLVQKYQELERLMKQTVKKISKRTELQNKVINLGMDNNLVINMKQITATYQQL